MRVATTLALALLASCSGGGQPTVVVATPAEPPSAPSAVAAPPAPVPSAEPAHPAGPDHVSVELPAGGGILIALLAEHAARSEKLGLRPFVEFSAPWCPPCKALKKYADDPQMVDAFRGTYLVVVDVDDWQSESFQDTGYMPKVIPMFYPIGRDGRAHGKPIHGGAWGTDEPQTMAPVLKEFFAKQR